MSTIKQRLLSPLFLFHIVFLFLLLVNFPFGKYFIGWDALSPEFNFPVNFSRALFSGAWQENYGLGVLGGHGFAATLPHTVITFLLSFVLPQMAIRSVFTFLCLYLGGLGMFVLVRNILSSTKYLQLKKINISMEQIQTVVPYVALCSALFYMLNLGTIQMFYAQLEAFIVHFAALPWLFWILIKFLTNPTKKTIWLFVAINFLASVQGFIPSLFVAYCIGLALFLLVYLFTHRSKDALKRVALVILLTLVTNAYWLFPLAYYQVTRSGVYLQSYNNLISTPHFIDINKKYGDIQNVALLKSYMFDAYELGSYMLQPWIEHHKTIIVPLIGYLFFLVTIFGVIETFFMRHWLIKAFAFVYLFFFVSMATNAPILSLVTTILQAMNPTYRQAFRIAFTKFSLGLGFSYSIFFALGLFFLFLLLKRYKRIRHFTVVFFVTTIGLLTIYALPAFQGNVLYKNITITIPKAYQDVITYFGDKENARIADFPQECAEGWFTYRWGYFGSGFYWYGIKQPILARTFDVWGNTNENYYWEITQALREEDFARIDNILNKYHVKWVLYDPNLQHCRNQRAYLLNNAFIEYLDSSPQYVLAKTFTSPDIQPIKVYVNKKYNTNNFVQIGNAIPNIGPTYNWNDNDIAYTENNQYTSDAKEKYASFYPFASLFTKRKSEELPIPITETKDAMILKTTIPKGLTSSFFTIKSYAELEKSVPVAINIQPTENSRYRVIATFLFPQIHLDGIPLVIMNSDLLLGEFSAPTDKFSLFLKGKELNKQKDKYFGIFSFQLDNHLVIVDNETQNPVFEWNAASDEKARSFVQQTFSVLLPQYTKGELTMSIPKINDKGLYGISSPNANTLTPYACNEQYSKESGEYEIGKDGNQEYIRLIAKNVDQCLSLYFPDVPTGYGYLAQMKTRHVSGNNLKFSMANKGKITYNDIHIYGKPTFSTSSYIIPPNYSSELGYDIRLQNTSESDETTVNDLADITFWYVPYEFIKSLRFDTAEVLAYPKIEASNTFTVSHPVNTVYRISLPKDIATPATIMLSQSYDNGWKAYESNNLLFPFFGKELSQHVLINNWANGWKTDKATNSIIIVYLPQYLEYLGFVFFSVALFFLFPRKSNKITHIV